MVSTYNVPPGSLGVDSSNSQQAQETPSHNASVSPCSIVPSLGFVKDTLFNSSALASCQKAELSPPQQDSPIDTGCESICSENRRCRSQPSKGDSNRNRSNNTVQKSRLSIVTLSKQHQPGRRYSINAVQWSQQVGGLLAQLTDQNVSRTRNREERSDPGIDDSEEARVARVSKVEKTCQDTNHIDTNLHGCEYRRETSSLPDFPLHHSEQKRPQHTKEDASQSASSSDTDGADLHLISDLRRIAILPKSSLATPPDSDTGLEHVDRHKEAESTISDGIPCYRLVPIPKSPSGKISFPPIVSQGPSIFTYSGSKKGINTPGPAFQEDNIAHISTTLPSVKARDIRPSHNTAAPVKKKRLLNLIWQDMGNGISRAYPRKDPPLLHSPKLPSTLSRAIEGWNCFVDSDEDSTISQRSLDEHADATTTNTNKIRQLFNDDNPRVPSWPLSSRREPVNIIPSDSETEPSATKIPRLPMYAFIAASKPVQ